MKVLHDSFLINGHFVEFHTMSHIMSRGRYSHAKRFIQGGSTPRFKSYPISHIPLEECYNAVKLQFEKIIITIIAQISAYISALSYG